MADKEAEAAASAQTRHPQQQSAASFYGPSLVNKQQQASAGPQKAALDSQPSGYYQNVTQKAKLILPTALWILIVVVGLCFLGLLSSLNKTINTLDTLVELEQAKVAKSQTTAAASGEHASGKHDSPLPSSSHRRHHDSIATAAASSAEAPISERLLSSQSAQDDSEGDSESGNSHRAKIFSSLFEPSGLFSLPSWTSLDRPERRHRRPAEAEADSMGNLLSDMIQAAGADGSKDDKFVPVGGSIIIASSSSPDDSETPNAESMIDSLLGKLLGSGPDGDDSAPADEDTEKLERLFKVGQAATKDNKAGSLITANIDRVNINVNMPSEQKQQPEDNQGIVPAFMPLSMPSMKPEDNSIPELEKSLEDLLSAIVNPTEPNYRQPEEQGSLFMPLLAPTQAAPDHHRLLSNHRFRAPYNSHVPIHHHHEHRHHLSPLASPLSPLSSILLGPPQMLGPEQQGDSPQVQRFVIAFDDDGNNNNGPAEMKQEFRPSPPVNSPYEFMAHPSLSDFLFPFFGSSGEHSAKHHHDQKNDENNPSSMSPTGLNDFGGQMSDELAAKLIESLFPTRETSEQKDQNSNNTEGDHSNDEIVIFGADLPYFSDKKQSLAKDEPDANDDRKQVNDMLDLLFGQQQNSESNVEPQIVQPKIKPMESVGTQTEAPSGMQVRILPFDGTQRPASMDSSASPSTTEIISISIGPHEQNSSITSESDKTPDQLAPVEAQQELLADLQSQKNVENLVGNLLNSMISMPQFGEEREPMRAEAQSSSSSGSKDGYENEFIVVNDDD